MLEVVLAMMVMRDEEMDVSEAKILVSEASKLFAGAIIFRGP